MPCCGCLRLSASVLSGLERAAQQMQHSSSKYGDTPARGHRHNDEQIALLTKNKLLAVTGQTAVATPSTLVAVRSHAPPAARAVPLLSPLPRSLLPLSSSTQHAPIAAVLDAALPFWLLLLICHCAWACARRWKARAMAWVVPRAWMGQVVWAPAPL